MKKYTTTYDTVVFIGRFRPSHLAHITTMQRALDMGYNLLILCGSANQPRTTKNPWNVAEISEMIYASLPAEMHPRVSILPLRDSAYNDQDWAMNVQNLVDSVTNPTDTIAIIGHEKDASSYYLNMFPQWDTIEMHNIDDINATDIRNAFFDAAGDMSNFDDTIGRNLPPAVHDFLKAFSLTADYASLVKEHLFLKNYKKMWENTPYPPIFVTVDTIVIQSGHILLVRRRAEPGKGLFALPGGYLDAHEQINTAAIRELKEETKIKIPVPVLNGSIKRVKVYDAPNRSPRGRVITHAHLIELPNGELPKVKGSSETDHVKWVPLSVFYKMEDQMFEDHYQIINDLLGNL